MDSTFQAVLAAGGCFFIIIFVFAVICVVCKSSKRRRPISNTQQSRARILNGTVPNSHLSSVIVDESATFDPNLSCISMDEVKAATNNFSPDLIIGDGSFGFTYEATLSDDIIVAIKKLNPNTSQGFREFRAKMETSCKLRHPNMVLILGYCICGAERVLIYEFSEKGYLDRWLHKCTGREEEFTWERKMGVVRGVANGLTYLHPLDAPIRHRDIKASKFYWMGSSKPT